MTSAELQLGGALARCKNISSYSNDTVSQVAKDAGNDTDFGAVMYIIAVLTFYSLGIVVMIVKYLKTERKEMEEEMVLESFFKGIPDKRIEHEIESVNRVAIHAFHTLTAARAQNRHGGSIPGSVESRDSEDHGLTHASHFSHHNEAENLRLKQTSPRPSQSDVYLSVDTNSFLHHGKHRRKTRANQKLADTHKMASFESDILEQPLQKGAAVIEYVSDTDVTDYDSDNQSRTRKLNAVSFSNDFLLTKDVTDKNVTFADAERRGVTADDERAGRPPKSGRLLKKDKTIDDEKSCAKRNKTVIFSDAIRPDSLDEDVHCKYDSTERLSPHLTTDRRNSDSSEIKSINRYDISQNANVSDASLTNNSSTGACSPKTKSDRALRLQRRFQLEPLKWRDITHNRKAVDSGGQARDGESQHHLHVSSSCTAISEAFGATPTTGMGSRVNSYPERETGAFANERSRLTQSNPRVLPYDSTSPRLVTTRVKVIDPQNSDGVAKKVLVTDL